MSASAVTTGLIRPLRQERVLLWCLLASVGLHALVLLGFSEGGAPAPAARSLSVLTASLAPVAKTPRAPRPQAQPGTVPAPEKRARALRPAPVEPVAPLRPLQHKPAAEAAQSAPPAAEPAAPAAVAARTAPAAPNPAGPTAPAQAGGNAAAAARPVSEADQGTLEQYRLALMAAAGHYKRYPAIAMEKGWQGRVDVRMVIGANGMLAGASVKASSGHVILDNQAVDMLRKGKTMVQIPASLRGREFSVDVPVIFKLDRPDP